MEDVPPAQIVTLMREVMKGWPSNEYLPMAPDLLRNWKGEEFAENDDGKTQRYARANVGAYDDWDEIQRRAAQGDHLQLLPPLPSNAADFMPGGIIFEDLKERLKSPYSPIINVNKERELATMSDAALLQRLQCDCGMETFHPDTRQSDPVMRALVLRFGRFLLEQLPDQPWTKEVGIEAWNWWITRQPESQTTQVHTDDQLDSASVAGLPP